MLSDDVVEDDGVFVGTGPRLVEVKKTSSGRDLLMTWSINVMPLNRR